MRGVAYDTRRGYLLKLDFLHAVSLGNAWFGRRQLTAAEIVSAYGAMVVSGAELAAFRPMVDLFCLPEACLISDVIQHFVDSGISFHPGYVYQDVKSAVGYLHESGVLHNAISAEPGRYIVESPGVATLLSRLRASGRKTMLLTNSGFKFVNHGMNHITRNTMAPGEWKQLFDLICVGADKPSWYKEDRPFRSLNAASGKVRWVPVEALLPGHVYYGGSFAELNRLVAGGMSGQDVLYLTSLSNPGARPGGDPWQDLSAPGAVGWRTGAVVAEVEREVAAQAHPRYRAALAALLDIERTVRLSGLDADALHAALRAGAAGDAATGVAGAGGGGPLLELRDELKHMLNARFGSNFRTLTGPTLFAHNLLRFADVYTARLENLLSLAPTHFLFPLRRALPHEPWGSTKEAEENPFEK